MPDKENPGWRRLMKPRATLSILSLLVIGFFGGIMFWGGFNWVVESTNTLEFCISCHEMKNTVYQEWQKTIHYQNRTGVQAVCADCHVPRVWHYKMMRKMAAAKEVLGQADGLHRHQGEVRGGEPAPYAVIGYMLFEHIDHLQQGMAAHGAEIMGDIPNFTNVQPVTQVSNVVLGS